MNRRTFPAAVQKVTEHLQHQSVFNGKKKEINEMSHIYLIYKVFEEFVSRLFVYRTTKHSTLLSFQQSMFILRTHPEVGVPAWGLKQRKAAT